MIKSIHVANIGPFRGEQSVEFGTGLLSIEGRYTDKPGESNRAGKSALIDLMRFGLYGVHRHRTLADYINRKADVKNDPIYVSIELGDPDSKSSIHIIREFDPGLQRFTTRIPEIEETQEFTQPNIQTYIETHLLGCNYDNAQRTWLVLQDEAKGIMKMSVAERKRFLLELFAPSIYPWDAYYVEANSRLNIVLTRQTEIQSRITNLRNRLTELSASNFQSQIVALRSQILELQERRQELRNRVNELNAAASPAALEKLRSDLLSAKRKLNDTGNSVAIGRKTLEKLKRDVETLNSKNKQLTELQTQLKKLQRKADNSLMQKVEADYTAVYNQHREQASQLSILLGQYKSVERFSGVCPVTGNECQSGADVCNYRQSLECQIADLTSKVDSLQTRRDELALQVDVFDRLRRDMDIVQANISSAELTISHLEASAELYADQQHRLSLDEASYREQKQAVDALDVEYKSRVSEHDVTYQRRLRELKQEQQMIVTKIQELDGHLTTALSDEQRKKTFELDLADAQKEFESLNHKVEVLKSMRPMLSSSGVPFYYLLASISEFEKSINTALLELGTSMSIEVEPYTMTKTLEPICRECGYEYQPTSKITRCPNPVCGAPREYKRRETLEILMKGSQFDVNFDEDSGGGQQWVSMGVRFALFNLLRERNLMGNIDFWCLDEVFAPLSEVSKFNMLSFLENICTTYNINQLFLITHTDISAVVPPAVVIERSEALQESHILS